MEENSKNFDFSPKTISDILKKAPLVSYCFPDRSSELEFLVRSLEDEMRKVDAFKRELPLCMQLLKDGIKRLKEEKLMEEESTPLKSNNNSEGEERAKTSIDFVEKRTWMSSVQLWTPPPPIHCANSGFINSRGGSGAFSPFKKSEAKIEEDRGSFGTQLHEQHKQQLQRKQRRCWSPELHRLFVDALQNLGGAEVATPKQIREHMKVEGLTNDEVKSHLQKYRIHVRRFSNASSTERPVCDEMDSHA
ncbi:homeodomain-like superfamily protein [Striga asiatica]|uniref:Homeodomain-like superfamily protein n=1 Tax=Striga asiatica TaxID=4170 RepID=A0A5A7PS90_STRAF|nr:homeodomain-like superfamily protein [Striga asiatica]